MGGCRYADVRRNVLGLHQLGDLGLYPIHVDGGDLGRKSTSSLTELKEQLIRRRMLEHKQLTVDSRAKKLLAMLFICRYARSLPRHILGPALNAMNLYES